ncbi:hypothetical protein [Paludisphaera borealis]|uniref:Uncharacterized protein n=1 Tax=Paludisphaera borealis TaxID=1387353 RepID=A0A1U7CXZ1_9BACT|nr:hypothetical protein [Paludisphaera borealis]APW63749.1 hypothetical protein BSF38_05325 [Paludisphaera borealis]MDR3620713.1 hypothetical protein [Paludisphaera borealis]
MNHVSTVLAYFGPEVQLPVISLVGSIVGLVMMAGAFPFRLAKERIRRWKAVASSRGSRT